MEIESFLKNIPPFTKYYLTGSLILAAVITFGIVPGQYISLDFEKVIFRLQVLSANF